MGSKKDDYVWPASDRQIQAIQKDDQLLFRACILVSKLFWNISREEIFKALNKRQSDENFYSVLANSKEKKGGNKPIVKNATLAKSFIGKSVHPKKYLDYGAGNMAFTYSMMKLLGLTKAWAVDVPQEFEKGWEETRKQFPMIHFEFLRDKFPFKEKFDLITCIMVMHHIENVKETIQLFATLIPKGGFLLIKEHDCCDSGDRLLIDIEHSLYLARNHSFDRIKEQRMWCKSHPEWTQLICDSGFKFIRRSWVYSYKEEIGPTRPYFALYQKL